MFPSTQGYIAYYFVYIYIYLKAAHKRDNEDYSQSFTTNNCTKKGGLHN
jgi:hypothetical protein